MKLFSRKLSHEPVRIRNVLTQLVGNLRDVLKTDLEAVVLYGRQVTAANPEMGAGPVNVMIVVADVTVDVLEQMRIPLEQAERAIPLACMVLTRQDISSSCDVFPIKFSNMQQHHELLYGDDVLAGLRISDQHLRLRCEQEVKNLLLRLRVIYLHRASKPSLMREALVQAVQSFMQDMQACLFVATGMVPELEADVVAEFGLRFELDMTIIDEIRELSQHDAESSPDQLRQAFDRLMSLVHKTAKTLDQLEASL